VDDIQASTRGKGINLEVGIYAHPFDQEDAIVGRRDVIERDPFTSFVDQTYQGIVHKYTTGRLQEQFKCPVAGHCLGMKAAPYPLQENGLPKEGQILEGGSAVIGKVISTIRPPSNSVKGKHCAEHNSILNK
jgi:DNA-directed RNA polymerase II subunit RPB2